MKAFRLILALGALCTSALGTAVDVDFAKRDIFVPEWEFELTPGGEKVYLNGTAQEVHRELLSRNPKWNEDFGFDSKLEAHAHEKRAELAKRTDFSDASYFCGGRWEYCNAGAIAEGRAYLFGLSGRPTNSPGPGACGRVSCSYNAAIYWCNDDTKPKTLESFGSIGDGVWELEKHCRRIGWNPSGLSIAGQIFHKTNWNVIVRKDSC
ncbi:hypothetical protein P175DRAFT_0516994 [Aspergillus ochraceoroseus IBT 24754]|uniref:Uncharacterized protein n=2 Tax=Aspergillus subgen. Nidulantes TaxID=2720870 RepID=A0A0F8V0W7_9EURO|nr:uncharacterized protein P175DRAFT_0516994 [Aspergillus ochraceoroseus IBT 24754]KKK16636.1 hypothetical protein ARAM_000532 [Aspergillus rambellii]PTU19968.1 hypothetical protein P175DRAFT_0516994 [Aspergillus ochraceoroseus IBT 24754]